MLIPRRRRLEREDIPRDGASSYALRTYQQGSFRFNWHHHPEVEIAYVVRGHGRRYVGDSIEDYDEGDFCLLAADLPHTWHSVPERGRTVASLCIQFTPERLGPALWSAPEMRAIARLLTRSARGLKATGRTRAEAGARMRALVEAPRGGWRDIAGLIDLLGLLADSAGLEPLTSAAYRATPGATADRRVNALVALLDLHPSEIPTQAEAARRIGLAPPAFSRFVRRAIGRTWAESVGERRVAAACRDLIESDDRIIDVALGAGFDNLSNFNRRFRAAQGCTPSGYRSRARQAEIQDT